MDEMILNQDGEVTDIVAPADFGNGLSFLNPSEFPDLDNVEVGISLKPDYMEFTSAGEFIRGIFNGLTEITTKDQAHPGQYKTIPAAVVQTKDGVKLNSGANLIGQLRNAQPGIAIQITYKGLEVTGSGNKVKAYDVRLLNVPRANVAPAVVARPALPETTPEIPHTNDTIWTVAQKQALIDNKLAQNDFAAKGMLGLSDLPGDATPSEVVDWGKLYRQFRTSINPDTQKANTAPEAAKLANFEYFKSQPAPF